MRKSWFLFAPAVGLLCLGLGRAADDKRDGKDDANANIDDQTFVMKASAAGLAEVNAGLAAPRHTTNADVRKFAKHLVDDHTKANQQLNRIADRKRFRVAQAMDAKHRMALERMATLRGKDFDRAFARQMVKDHEEAISLFRAESKHGRDADLKAFASKTLPTLEEHLHMAEKLAGHDGDKDRSSDRSSR